MSQIPEIIVFESNEMSRRAIIRAFHRANSNNARTVLFPATAQELVKLADKRRSGNDPVMVVSNTQMTGSDIELYGSDGKDLPAHVIKDSHNIHFFWFTAANAPKLPESVAVAIIPKRYDQVSLLANEAKAGYLLASIMMFINTEGDLVWVKTHLQELQKM